MRDRCQKCLKPQPAVVAVGYWLVSLKFNQPLKNYYKKAKAYLYNRQIFKNDHSNGFCTAESSST